MLTVTFFLNIAITISTNESLYPGQNASFICSLVEPDIHNVIFEWTRINGTSNTIMMLAEDADIEGSGSGDGSLQHNSTLTILNVSYTDNGDGYYCDSPNCTEANCSESSTSYLTGMCVS